tara:strand:+ start:7 stop:987 length:981 start_codon:yes stop_codon:yes gene_type:complete
MVKLLRMENGIKIYEVKKKYGDKIMEDQTKFATKKVKPNMIDKIINHDCDIYSDTGVLLIKFRKNVLTPDKTEMFYKNIKKFAMTPTCNRGSASGSKKRDVRFNPKIMTNIFGYMDGYSPSQKIAMKNNNITVKFNVRETRFTQDFPNNYEKTIPMIKEINALYKKELPVYFKKQNKKAIESKYKIANTAFTTVTTNVNWQTSIHKDKGDDSDGFGNLVVLEEGKYKGGETCLPQYGIGVDVRMGDMLFMNVHEWHGNLPIEKINKEAIRLSVVCYLRLNVWKWSRNMTPNDVKSHNQTIRNLSKARKNNKTKKCSYKKKSTLVAP